jgi:hypothetical protein
MHLGSSSRPVPRRERVPRRRSFDDWLREPWVMWAALAVGLACAWLHGILAP